MKTINIILILLVVLFISGCGKPMTRVETIQAVKECEDAGMKALIYKYSLDGSIARVDCAAKEK
ncbi:MAG: hypothetical protein WC055_01155 [Melioribacteraceae bacterium]